ncbi:MAG: MBL fold metallo-hydrolase [Eubacteriales bacterium]
MKITYLGQAGLMFETGGKKIMVDPYLSDSVAKIQPQNYRRQPIDERFLRMQPDIIVITHDHADHLDRETLSHYLTEESEVSVLAPYSAWKEVRTLGGDKNNYIMFNDGTTWTEGDVVFRAVRAEHSDEYAIGVIITAEEKNYYVTGDTLYSERVFASLPSVALEAVFLPVNGKGNNMNATDATRFAQRVLAKYAVPIHVGMFDEMTGLCLKVKNRRLPEIYKEIVLESYGQI